VRDDWYRLTMEKGEARYILKTNRKKIYIE